MGSLLRIYDFMGRDMLQQRISQYIPPSDGETKRQKVSSLSPICEEVACDLRLSDGGLSDVWHVHTIPFHALLDNVCSFLMDRGLEALDRSNEPLRLSWRRIGGQRLRHHVLDGALACLALQRVLRLSRLRHASRGGRQPEQIFVVAVAPGDG